MSSSNNRGYSGPSGGGSGNDYYYYESSVANHQGSTTDWDYPAEDMQPQEQDHYRDERMDQWFAGEPSPYERREKYRVEPEKTKKEHREKTKQTVREESKKIKKSKK